MRPKSNISTKSKAIVSNKNKDINCAPTIQIDNEKPKEDEKPNRQSHIVILGDITPNIQLLNKPSIEVMTG